MATFIVTQVRKELAPNGTHRHIAAVCTENGKLYTRQEVVESLERGDTWKARSGNQEAIIRKLRFCPRPTCLVSPYIRTRPDSYGRDNLEELPEC